MKRPQGNGSLQEKILTEIPTVERVRIPEPASAAGALACPCLTNDNDVPLKRILVIEYGSKTLAVGVSLDPK